MDSFSTRDRSGVELGQFADQRPFLSMKLIKGKTLAALLEEHADVSGDRTKLLNTFEQIRQTMAYAHSRGVIHRDLKPANIMVGAFGEVQVMDWGLAKVLGAGGIEDEKKANTRHRMEEPSETLIHTARDVGSNLPERFGSTGSDTMMGSVMGTPAYMPPEQALGELDRVDERADVFGLGAILCEILTGKPPYVADSRAEVFRRARRGWRIFTKTVASAVLHLFLLFFMVQKLSMNQPGRTIILPANSCLDWARGQRFPQVEIFDCPFSTAQSLGSLLCNEAETSIDGGLSGVVDR